MRTYVHSLDGEVTIALYGPDHPKQLRQLVVRHGAKPDSVCFIKAPSTPRHPGYQLITKPTFGQLTSNEPDVYAEGVILTQPGSGAIIRTADCPTLILHEQIKRRVVVTHAGRAALTPQNKLGEEICNIVTKAHQILTEGSRQNIVSAYITGSICANCFRHDTAEARKLIKPFEQFGKCAFRDEKKGTLDLVAIIEKQLLDLGVHPFLIDHSSLCTHESSWLASYRRDRSEARNAIVVVL